MFNLCVRRHGGHLGNRLRTRASSSNAGTRYEEHYADAAKMYAELSGKLGSTTTELAALIAATSKEVSAVSKEISAVNAVTNSRMDERHVFTIRMLMAVSESRTLWWDACVRSSSPSAWASHLVTALLLVLYANHSWALRGLARGLVAHMRYTWTTSSSSSGTGTSRGSSRTSRGSSRISSWK